MLGLGSLIVAILVNSAGVHPDGIVWRTRNARVAKQGVPHEINYQGWLGNASDTTGVTGSFDMTFTLYDAETGGTALWAETHESVKVTRGIFNVLLGSVNSLPENIFTGEPLWLEIKIGDETLSPRKKLVSVGYAIQAERAENASHAVYSDTAQYAVNVDINSVDSARVAGNAWQWAGKTWGEEYPKSNYADTAGYADTASYAKVVNINYVDSARVAGNTWQWAGKSWGEEYPKSNLADTALIADTANYVSGANVVGEVAQANYADTAKYALVAPNDTDWVRDTLNKVLLVRDYLGLGRNGVANAMLGDSINTHINLGVNCTTGVAGENYYFCTINGGKGNQALNNYTTVSGGKDNIAKKYASTVSGGYNNTANDSFSVVGGGKSNYAGGDYATISGGRDNFVSRDYGTVSGGRENKASRYAVVGGGYADTASGVYSTVSGGYAGTASGLSSTVGGGYNNTCLLYTSPSPRD